MIREAINELKKYTLGKKNTETVEINVLHLNRVIKALEQTRWIPVTERLPEKEGKYLVTTFSGGMYDVDTSYFFIYEDGETEWSEYGVESWMPLPPEPYKESDVN